MSSARPTVHSHRSVSENRLYEFSSTSVLLEKTGLSAFEVVPAQPLCAEEQLGALILLTHSVMCGTVGISRHGWVLWLWRVSLARHIGTCNGTSILFSTIVSFMAHPALLSFHFSRLRKLLYALACSFWLLRRLPSSTVHRDFLHCCYQALYSRSLLDKSVHRYGPFFRPLCRFLTSHEPAIFATSVKGGRAGRNLLFPTTRLATPTADSATIATHTLHPAHNSTRTSFQSSGRSTVSPHKTPVLPHNTKTAPLQPSGHSTFSLHTKPVAISRASEICPT